MPRRGGTGTRAAALTRARQAVARREAERIQREKNIRDTLTNFYQAHAAAQRIRGHARERAQRIIAEAENAAGPMDAAAGEAVRRLEQLGETRAGIADLCGLPLNEIRMILAQARHPSRDAVNDSPNEHDERVTAGSGTSTTAATGQET